MLDFFVEDILVNTNMEAVVQEIHNLSYFYHWGLKECWECPCSYRGVFNDKIKQQLKQENNAVSKSATASPSKGKRIKKPRHH